MLKANYGKLLITVEKSGINEGKLIIDVKIKNNASVQSIIFPIEEIRLLADNAIIPLYNYKFENNMDAGQEVVGQLFFNLVAKPKKIILQFGKSSLPKTILEIKL